jgi:pimeloyl-ACP methyl ester carboxylesterase
MQVTTSQGEVFVETDGQGQTLLLLHADGSSSQEFEPVLDRLSDHHRVIRLDLPGHGRSPRRAFSSAYYKENAKAAADVARQLCRDQPVWAIGSGGGAVCALWMAILAPQRVAGVVADSFSEFYRAEDLAGLLAAHQQPDADLVDYLVRMHGPDWQVVVRELDRVLSEIAQESRSVVDWRLEEIHCPVLMTGSRTDPFLMRLAPRLLAAAEQVASAQLILYPQGDHPCMWSQQDQFWNDALAFIRACGCSPAAK